MLRISLSFLLISALLGFSVLDAAEAPPAAEKKPVVNEYHGTKVTDDYQWLENESDPAVKSWSEVENKQTRAHLDALPGRNEIVQQLTDWYARTEPSYSAFVSRDKVLFGMKFQPPKQQPMLVRMAAVNDLKSEKVLVDPNGIDSSGKTAIDWFKASLDGKLLAVSLSTGGSEDGTLHFYDGATGREVGDTIPHVQYPTAGGSAAWNAAGDGVYYTRFPRKGERPDADLNFYQQVYFHKLGTPESEDTYSIGKEFPRIAEIELESSHDGRYVVASVANGDGGDFAHYLLGPEKKWTQITQFSDQVKLARLGRDNALYLLSRAGAPRGKVLRLPLETPELSKAKEIVPTGEAVMQRLEPTAKAIYVGELLGGPSQLRRFDLDGKNGATIPLLKISNLLELVSVENGSLIFRAQSFTEPSTWFEIAAEGSEPMKTVLMSTSPVSFADIEVTREFAPSKDGTKVPLNIVRRKGTKLDGNNPTLLYGYGGYGISMSPTFDFARRLWFDRGGIYVVANIRGGGEFGEEWHKAGNLTNKQTVFDDF
ncbi:MAG: prolyl oligopeptidase family serine peptidase, partial [Chthoniobacterales bacterium]